MEASTMLSSNEVYIATEKVKVRPEKSGVVIEGIAMPIDKPSRNGVLYRRESVINSFETLKNRPVLFNHDPNRVIGHVVEAWIDGENLFYRADIDPAEEDIVRKLKRGDISNVSISVLYENPTMKGDVMEVDVKEFLELSIVTIPGFVDTTIQMKEKLAKQQEEIDRRYQNPDGTFKKQRCGDGSGDDESKFCGCVNYMHNVKGLSWDSAKKLCAYIKKQKGASLDIDFIVEILKKIDEMSKEVDSMDEKIRKEQDEQPAEEPTADPVEALSQKVDAVSAKVDELMAKVTELDARVSKLENPPSDEEPEAPAEAPTTGEGYRVSYEAVEETANEVLEMIV